MGRPRTYRCEGVVLKSVPLGEAGLLVTLYTTTLGTLRAAARGVRKTTSKMVGHLEPLNRVELALATGRGGLDIVTQAQVLETFASLKADLEGSSRGLYLAELVDGFGTEGSAGPELHTLLVDTLRFLSDSSDRELTSRHFELHLLRVSGFMPELYRCVECKGELVQGGHRFSPDVGGTLCITCTPPKIPDHGALGASSQGPAIPAPGQSARPPESASPGRPSRRGSGTSVGGPGVLAGPGGALSELR